MILWRVVIVDDESAARNHIRQLLSQLPDMEVIGEASDIEGAESLCNRLRPDLVFLDVNLARGTGFDLLPLLHPLPKVIFVTAFDRFAQRAFEVNAADYLLKPVTASRMKLALSRLSQGQALTQPSSPASSPEPADTQPQFQMDDMVFLPMEKSLRVVSTNEITSILADGNYSTVGLKDGTNQFVTRSVGEWEKRLPQQFFSRLDRSIIVNRSHLREVKVINRDQARLMVAGNKEGIILGRTALARAKALFKST
ncbi:MAG: LytR/AlgR family response regulator transcription factor [Verrucomicrobium sp.]|nr:response regulator transcription factor [Verrucomicrobium sp.]